MATLVITAGPAHGEQFALASHQLILIGRDDECTFQVLDPAVSRRHMQVRAEPDGGHVVLDYESTHGVTVNAARVEGPTRLSDGDTIRAGGTTIVYLATDTPDAKAIHELLRRRGEHMKSTLAPRMDSP